VQPAPRELWREHSTIRICKEWSRRAARDRRGTSCTRATTGFPTVYMDAGRGRATTRCTRGGLLDRPLVAIPLDHDDILRSRARGVRHRAQLTARSSSSSYTPRPTTSLISILKTPDSCRAVHPLRNFCSTRISCILPYPCRGAVEIDRDAVVVAALHPGREPVRAAVPEEQLASSEAAPRGPALSTPIPRQARAQIKAGRQMSRMTCDCRARRCWF